MDKSDKQFKIDKIAIIGGGPSGLVTLNEFLHTSREGSSTIVQSNCQNKYPKDPAFKEIVVFEQNDATGGVWKYSKETDPMFPVDIDDYSNPRAIRPHFNSPDLKDLLNSDTENPIVRPLNQETVEKNLMWNKSAVYDHLFTNIPKDLMRFSTSFDDPIIEDKNSTIYKPFVTHQNVLKYVENFAHDNDLLKYVRFNSNVEKVFKKGDSWYVTVCKIDKRNKNEIWYTEKFDAVVLAIGRFNIPFYPKIDGFQNFVRINPSIVLHSKSFRKTDDLKGKKVLVVGSNVSALDIIQYLIPISEVHISGNTKIVSNDGKSDENKDNKTSDWVEDVLSDESLSLFKHPRISKFEGNSVHFIDGVVESGFDTILFCTGYHLHYPFLDIPENDGKEYISISSGYDGNPNYAQTKVDNLYLYTFTISDPTICHIGVAQNPLFFLTSEANCIAIAGVWSNHRALPAKQIQRDWINSRFKGRVSGFQVFDENTIRDLIEECYALGPSRRFNFLPLVKNDEIKNSKLALRNLFYEFATSKLDEFDPSCQYDSSS